MNKHSLRSIFTYLALFIAFLLLLLATSIFRLQTLNDTQMQSSIIRYQSYLLADELRQSSDDLTRLARTYVTTADPKWEAQYFEVLAIRNGQSRRFEHPERITWDFEAAGQTVRRSQAQIALRALMEQAGFTDEEFRLLNEAENNSNQLVYTETVAMNAVKGLYEDAQGRFTVRAEPDQDRAIRMMHDQSYHNEKARIMAPINQFLAVLDERTSAQVNAAAEEAALWLKLALGLSVFAFITILLALTWVWRFVLQVVGGEPREVRRALDALAKGNVQQPIAHQYPRSILGHAEQLRLKLYEVTQKINQSALNLNSTSELLSESSVQANNSINNQVIQNEQVSAAIEELSAAISEVSNNTAESASTSKATGEAVQQAVIYVEESAAHTHSMAQKLTDAEASVAQLSQDMAFITKILASIQGVADQTNLLALNAAIEAARAGEQGRGFAVVADEVRSLAQNSQDATKQISVSIERLVQSSGKASGIITECSNQASQIANQAGRTIEQLNDALKKVLHLSSMADQVAVASEQQTATAREVAHNVTMIYEASTVTQGEIEQVKKATIELMEMSTSLKQQVAHFTP